MSSLKPPACIILTVICLLGWFGIATAEDHPCSRTCIANVTMECTYDFTLEYFYTMSKGCYSCPFVLEDCFREDCIPGDGRKRQIATVNRIVPGPSIEVCLGDEIVVNVENGLLTDTTTIHWHGQHQTRTPYMDGVPSVTQCPIGPGSTFTYTFTAENVGTHFWHSHSGTQRADGLFGPLIIRQPEEDDPHTDLYDYDLSSHTMIIIDWVEKLGVENYLGFYHSSVDNKPTNILINGKGPYEEFVSENVTAYTPYERFYVEQGYRYRFRVINAGALNCPIEIAVDNHTLTLISTDGDDIEPVEAETLVTYAGERFDIVINADQDDGVYWIRFRGFMDCDERFNSVHQAAILQYSNSSDLDIPDGILSYDNAHKEGLQINPLGVGMEGTNDTLSAPYLKSLRTSNEILRQTPDFKYVMSFVMRMVDNPVFHKKNLYGFFEVDEDRRTVTPQMNNISMQWQEVPLLPGRSQILPEMLCNDTTMANSHCDVDFCACTYVVQIPLNSLVEVIIVDTSARNNHPFHLHGYNFSVVGMEALGRNITYQDILVMDEQGLLLRNLDSAPIKDTVSTPSLGYTILRFVASNPGYWFMHCHLELHAELGMGLVFKIGEDSDMLPVPNNFPQCGNYDVRSSSISHRQSQFITGTYIIMLMYVIYLFM